MSGFFGGAGIRVVPEGIRSFGNTNLHAAEQIMRSGTVDLQANVAALSPALGLIGGDFLAAFAAAQSAHTRSIGDLAVAYASNGAAAHDAAAAYEHADAATGATLGHTAGML
ncbi:type VII secretion target [Rhodococcus chondri]|uniref:Type VII secretion target n=1 Tax=Rhodococcus chondri TaxID=3065941 RepID=A0ABU7JRK9_9NOCA|nr:type VII secretion target [Rhodococcus sp. CC-R104]MEE2031947.1 type VII secretion target [Rhodococcus sp. CC-R104]